MEQMLKGIQPWLNQAVERLSAEFNLETIILFGFWACGEATRRSDIDLFVVRESNSSPLERIGRVLSLLADAPRPIDAIVYTPQELERCKQTPAEAFTKREGASAIAETQEILDYVEARIYRIVGPDEAQS